MDEINVEDTIQDSADIETSVTDNSNDYLSAINNNFVTGTMFLSFLVSTCIGLMVSGIYKRLWSK